MTLECKIDERKLTIFVGGELDHHRAREVMREIGEQIDAALPRELVLDLNALTFSDSSGIAVLIQANRRMTQIEGKMTVVKTPKQAQKVFSAAGLERLICFE